MAGFAIDVASLYEFAEVIVGEPPPRGMGRPPIDPVLFLYLALRSEADPSWCMVRELKTRVTENGRLLPSRASFHLWFTRPSTTAILTDAVGPAGATAIEYDHHTVWGRVNLWGVDLTLTMCARSGVVVSIGRETGTFAGTMVEEDRAIEAWGVDIRAAFPRPIQSRQPVSVMNRALVRIIAWNESVCTNLPDWLRAVIERAEGGPA